MQQPTCTNLRIRSTADAHKIFAAIQQGILHMVTRRLDADERLALRSGCVYAWEERGPHSELTGLGIERFTEGRRWSPSRVRDEFLFYYEKFPAAETNRNTNSTGAHDETENPPPRGWDPLVKQTYSVWVQTERGRRKWHLTAYFTQSTIDHLGCIDDDPRIKDIIVPPGVFTSTRIGKSRSRPEDSSRSDAARAASSIMRTYAPFPAPYHYQQGSPDMAPVLMHEPYKTTNPVEPSSPYDHSPSPVSPQGDGYSDIHRLYSPHQSNPSMSYPSHTYSSPLSQDALPSGERAGYPIRMRPAGDLGAMHPSSPGAHFSPWQPQLPEYQQEVRFERHSGSSKATFLSQGAASSSSYGQRTSEMAYMQTHSPAASHNTMDNNLFSSTYPLQSALTSSSRHLQLDDMTSYPLSPLQIPDSSMHSQHQDSPFNPVGMQLPLDSSQDNQIAMAVGMQDPASFDSSLVPLEVLRRPIRYQRDPADERTLRLLREQGSL
ncbi:hypothetical protein D9613_000318 [Agrocybe pediades]|uniref:cAMP-independent regulatory protein pac2 n=1 Tax=Agrocybe pediades TaxID=84607 RepID=A0A8H4R173_9AGAR|nr:hypothetical protein D9613_000318 [Agrocybe pediades]